MNIAFNNLNGALIKALSFSRANNIEIVSMFLGIAGIEFGDSINVLRNKLVESLEFDNIYVHGDLRSVVELGLENVDNGLVIISGTGFNMALKEKEKITNVGGWGYLADDYLSGFDLGKDALVYASRAINKVGEDTILVNLLEKELGNSLWYSMADIYSRGVSKVASFAKLVMHGYRMEDKICLEIINTRVNRLVETIKKLMINVEEKNLVLFGGIFENNKEIVDLIRSQLSDAYNIVVTNKKTVYGASKVAFKHSNLLLNDDFEKNFVNSYNEVSK